MLIRCPVIGPSRRESDLLPREDTVRFCCGCLDCRHGNGQAVSARYGRPEISARELLPLADSAVRP